MTIFTKTKSIRRSLSLFLVALTLVSIVSDQADAKRRRRHRSRTRRAVINEPKLYDRLGGAKAVSDLVDNWVRASLADPRLNGTFGDVAAKPDLVVKLRKNLNDQLCEVADGPCTLKADAKKTLDLGAMSDEKFVVFSSHLVTALEARAAGEREKNELIGRLGSARNDDLPENENE
jgi:hypothetical protein